MSSPLLIALPSKGRLKEQTEAWLADCGFGLEMAGGARGYRAAVKGVAGAEAALLSSSDIAAALEAGDVHLGVVGEDLLRERGDDVDERVALLQPLGFGHADLVVAAPQSWIDVQGMADIDAVAMAYLARTGRRMRVATKYGVQTRAFFARHGIADYRIVESSGATEGAPAAGAAELIVDITTTGATLLANGLRPVADGVILRSQAHLAASLTAPWTRAGLAAARRMAQVIEAKARARGLVEFNWPTEQAGMAEAATGAFLEGGASRRPNGLLADRRDLFDVAGALGAAGVGPVSIARPDYVFHADCPSIDALARRLDL